MLSTPKSPGLELQLLLRFKCLLTTWLNARSEGDIASSAENYVEEVILVKVKGFSSWYS